MAKFLIEVPHESEKKACIRAIQILLQTGSHYLTNAQFGCRDGVHKGWVIVDVETREEARQILPPAYRPQSMIVGLSRFSMEELDDMLLQHEG